VHVSLSATLQWIRRFGNLQPLVAFGEGRPLPRRCVPLDPEVAAVSTTIERDPAGDVEWDGPGPGPGQEGGTMSVIRHAASFKRLGIREGKAPMRLDAHKPEWLPRR
jgi:hypothetical protein